MDLGKYSDQMGLWLREQLSKGVSFPNENRWRHLLEGEGGTAGRILRFGSFIDVQIVLETVGLDEVTQGECMELRDYGWNTFTIFVITIEIKKKNKTFHQLPRLLHAYHISSFLAKNKTESL